MVTALHILKRHGLWAAPILFLILLTPFSADIDMFVAKMTFNRSWSGTETLERGFFTTPFFDFIYLYGVLPAQILCAIALIAMFLSIWMPNLKRYRAACAVLSITLGLGSLFITHTILKECWGRPRPRQTQEFGGHQPFRAYYQPLFNKAPEPSKSFPSGHSTCGFYFFCLYFLGRRFQMPRLAKLGIVLSLFLGGMLSAARIVQGGHFISDVYVAGLIMWLTSYFVDYLVYDAPVLAKFRKNYLSSEQQLQTAS
jgi:membrane-associated PAP2 superfamily phosphatase